MFDHIDLRVPNLADVTSFYETLLPALGFLRRVEVDDWLQYEDPMEVAGGFFGVTESPGHVANENRIAFRADSVAQVEELSEIAITAGARNVEGPMPYDEGYHAVFFEDPAGNRFEICYREEGAH